MRNKPILIEDIFVHHDPDTGEYDEVTTSDMYVRPIVPSHMTQGQKHEMVNSILLYQRERQMEYVSQSFKCDFILVKTSELYTLRDN